MPNRVTAIIAAEGLVYYPFSWHSPPEQPQQGGLKRLLNDIEIDLSRIFNYYEITLQNVMLKFQEVSKVGAFPDF